MNRSYTLDTCVLMEREDCVEIFRNGEENEINIPITVINELDGLIKNNEKRPKAIKVVQNLLKNKEYINFTGDVTKIVNNDDKILNTVDKNQIFVTNDLTLQLKSHILGIQCEEFRESLPFASESEIYTGFIDWYKNEDYVNNCFYFKDGKLFFWNGKVERCVDYEREIWKTTPKDVYQKAAIELLTDRNIPLTTIQSKAGTGKAQPLYSKLLTPNGWKEMGDVNIGDIVYDKHGKQTKVIGTYLQGKKDIYEVTFNDKTSTRCCDEHLWEVSYCNNKSWKVKELKEIKNDIYVENRQRLKWFVPYNECVDFDEREIKINPYLMGCLLGDGGLTNSSIYLSNKDKQVIEEVEKILKYEYDMKLNHKLKYDYSLVMNEFKNSGKKDIISNPVKRNLIHYNLYGLKSKDKFIPSDYLFNSRENRIELLKGLMDTDGGIYRNYCCFYTSSEKLKNDVTFLCRSLGFKVTCLTKENPKYTQNEEVREGLTSYTLCLSHNDINPFKLERKRELYDNTRRYPPSKGIKEINYVGREECKCIMVESETQTYITDDFIVTHNTLLSLASALYMTFEKKLYDKIIIVKSSAESSENIGYRPGNVNEKMEPIWNNLYKLLLELHEIRPFNKAFIDPESPLPEINPRFIEFAPLNFMRGQNIKNTYVIVDEGQNITRHEMRTLLTRMGNNCKVVVEGDTSQVDDPRCNTENNGLNWIVKLLKGDKRYAHLKMNCKQTRGPICDMVTYYKL